MTILKIEIYLFVCRACGHKFEDIEMPRGTYGTFLLRSSGGALSVLLAMSSPEFQEVKELVRTCRPRLDEYGQAALIHAIFGEVACDCAKDGTFFVIEGPPLCPVCRSAQIADCQSIDPSRYLDMDISAVTFSKWHALSRVSKLTVVRKAVETYEAARSKSSPGRPSE